MPRSLNVERIRRAAVQRSSILAAVAREYFEEIVAALVKIGPTAGGALYSVHQLEENAEFAKLFHQMADQDKLELESCIGPLPGISCTRSTSLI
jgi:hypothetical protein